MFSSKKFEEVKMLETALKIKTTIVLVSICLIGFIIFVGHQFKTVDEKEESRDLLLSNNILDSTLEDQEVLENIEDENEQEEIVFDGLTRQELIDKLNRNLNSTLSDTGELFADYAIEYGIDPYLAVAIVLHETGCSWNCSELVTQCNNVGGQKGNPGCFGGSYAAFSTLEEGIKSYMDNLYQNYYAIGLTTPELINTKYAASTTWASKIHYYINKIKAS
jgi:hypothetical protein